MVLSDSQQKQVVIFNEPVERRKLLLLTSETTNKIQLLETKSNNNGMLVYSVSTTQLATKLPPIQGTSAQATAAPEDK